MKRLSQPLTTLPLILLLVTACANDRGEHADRSLAAAHTALRTEANPSRHALPATGFSIDEKSRAMAPVRVRTAAVYGAAVYGAAVFDAIVSGTAEAAWDNRTRNDFNGDGRSDILWFHDALPAAAYWTMDGARVLGAIAHWTATGYGIVGSGDFDGDGFEDDLLWSLTADNALFAWLGR